MPSTASSVGPFELPLPAGPAFARIDDPTLVVLASYLAFWLNYDLNAALGSLQSGRSSDGSSVLTAVPAGNIFGWNPLKPVPLFVRGKQDGAGTGAPPYALPALYVGSDTDKRKPWSQLYGMRERVVKALWIFEDATLPGWNVSRTGLRAAACATLFRAIENRYHPGFNSRETIAVQLRLAGEGLVYQGSEQLWLSARPMPGGRDAEHPVVRAFPAAMATYLVYERDNGMTALPSEQTPDLRVSIGVNEAGDVQNPLRVATLVVPAPPRPADT